MKKYLRQEGFSLIELLVVMAIVGTLAVIAVPRFNNAITLANTTKVQGDLQTLNSAIMLYYAQEGKYPDDIYTKLKPYVVDIDNVKPPSGKCMLKDGSVVEITATAYTLSTDKEQALCQDKPLSDFGRKK